MTENLPGSFAEPLHERLSRAAECFRGALIAVVDHLPVGTKRPATFERMLKLDRNLSSRILRAIRMQDPLATLHRMPGAQGIRLFLAASGRAGVDRQIITRAEQLLTDLERLVANEVGTWQDLNAAIAGWLPEARDEFELANRQTAYRALSNLKGVTADVELSVTLIHPSAEHPRWLDRAGITGHLRLRRLRPGTPMNLIHGRSVTPLPASTAQDTGGLQFGYASIAPPTGVQRLSLDGEPIDAEHPAPLLAEFSCQPAPQFGVRVTADSVYYVLGGDRVGIGSAVDLLFADVMRRRYAAYSDAGTRPAAPGSSIEIPVKVLILDVLVHRDAWVGVEPELRAYDMIGNGPADPTDPGRDPDRIDLPGGIQEMGTRLEAFRTKDVGRYVDMIRYLCTRLGWDATAFRGYRYRLEYPVRGTQVHMVFRPPSG